MPPKTEGPSFLAPLGSLRPVTNRSPLVIARESNGAHPHGVARSISPPDAYGTWRRGLPRAHPTTWSPGGSAALGLTPPNRCRTSFSFRSPLGFCDIGPRASTFFEHFPNRHNSLPETSLRAPTHNRVALWHGAGTLSTANNLGQRQRIAIPRMPINGPSIALKSGGSPHLNHRTSTQSGKAG